MAKRIVIIGAMRSIAQYLAKAADFDELTVSTSEPSLKKRYADVAECYRLRAAPAHCGGCDQIGPAVVDEPAFPVNCQSQAYIAVGSCSMNSLRQFFQGSAAGIFCA